MPGPAPTGSLAGMDPELQQRLEGAAAELGSPEWKVRLQALEAMQAAVGGQAGALPAQAQLWLAEVLRERVADANLKCQQQVGARIVGRWEEAHRGVLCSMPGFGSSWLDNARLACVGSYAEVYLSVPGPSVSHSACSAHCRLWPR